MVTIEHREVGDVVQMFQRINSTGTKLGLVDFMRAATWSEMFDRNEQLKDLQTWMERVGFEVPDEAIVKILGIIFGRQPLPEPLFTLREVSSEELFQGMATVQSVIGRCLELMRDEFKVFSYDYVPYEGQMLVFAKILLSRPALTEDEITALREWYWRTSLNEALQGRPDHYIARLVDRAEAILAGEEEVRTSLSQRDFLFRKFTKGKALSCAVASMFAWRGARSIATGVRIPPEVYMAEFSQQHFERILGPMELRRYGGTRSADRIMANIVVLTDQDRMVLGRGGVRQRLAELGVRGGREDVETLESQLVSRRALEALQNRDPEAFLEARAADMFEAASELMR